MFKSLLSAALAILALGTAAQPEAVQAAAPLLLQVTLSPDAPAPESGRLLVFAEPWDKATSASNGQAPASIDNDDFSPTGVAIAAQETSRIAPGETQWVDADHLAFPAPFSALPPGAYAVQVVLDVGHDYNYLGRTPQDAVSPVLKVEVGSGGALPAFVLAPGHAASAPDVPPAGAPPQAKADYAAARPDVDVIDFVSPALSAFWGRPIHMRGWVLRPPGYAEGHGTYPTVYWTHGFGGQFSYLFARAAHVHADMAAGRIPPMIYVFLDQSSPTGTHEFADSVNNGPWGQALTAELIPDLERRYRMDARPSGRFLTGHSSGGWATLWLQTRYPKLFGGTWSTSPDPSDFHDFTGVDLYAPDADTYHRPDGSAYPLVRDKGQVKATFEQFARLERVLGPYGGQMSSFDWVFSPKGPDGRPQPMFDRDTGAVDPAVVAYWRDHYDIAWRLAHHWRTLKPDLDGKIHVFVGTADTFYLDGAAHRLKAVLDGLGAKAQVTFIEGRTHMDLYRVGDDRYGLEKQIAWAMWATARPGSALKPKS